MTSNIHAPPNATRDLLGDRVRLGLLPFIARLLLASEFVIAVNGKITGWDGQASYMGSKGMHFIAPLLAAALAIELIGSACLITGYHAKTAAAVMFVYLGIVSVELHAFWNASGNASGMAMTQFFKNLGMMGGLLMIAAYGAGSWALGRHESPERSGGPATSTPPRAASSQR